MRRLERGGTYPLTNRRPIYTWGTEPGVQELADALQSAMPDAYADASAQEMQGALANVMEAMTPAEAFDFGSALNRIAKGANQVLSDPTFKSVAGTALPIAGQVIGGIYGGPIGAQLGGNLGNLAAGALTGRGAQPPAARPPAASAAPPSSPVAGGSSAAAQALVLTQQPDVLRALLSTALGQYGRKEVSGIPTAQVLSQISRLFGEAAADADELTYLGQESGAEAGIAESAPMAPGPPAVLYADLIGADNAELAEAAEWEGMF